MHGREVVIMLLHEITQNIGIYILTDYVHTYIDHIGTSDLTVEEGFLSHARCNTRDGFFVRGYNLPPEWPYIVSRG